MGTPHLVLMNESFVSNSYIAENRVFIHTIQSKTTAWLQNSTPNAFLHIYTRTHTYQCNTHITHLLFYCLKGEDPVEVQKISARRELVMRDYREKHCGEFANRSFTERKTHLNLDLTSA